MERLPSNTPCDRCVMYLDDLLRHAVHSLSRRLPGHGDIVGHPLEGGEKEGKQHGWP